MSSVNRMNVTDGDKKVGAVFAEHREKRNWSIGKVAKLIGVGQERVRYYERGNAPIPWKRFEDLCNVYGLSSEQKKALADMHGHQWVTHKQMGPRKKKEFKLAPVAEIVELTVAGKISNRISRMVEAIEGLSKKEAEKLFTIAQLLLEE